MMRIVGNHPNILRLIDVFKTENRLHIVLEFIQGPSLLDYAAEKSKWELHELHQFLRDIGSALVQCHANKGCSLSLTRPVAHHDVKLDNMLVDLRNNRLLLIDFGLASLERQNLSARYVGSPLYMAPELIECQQSGLTLPYNPFSADVWSMGVCLFILHYDELPFDADKDWEIAEQILEKQPAYPKRRDDPLRPLIERMLSRDPARRPTMQAVLDELKD